MAVTLDGLIVIPELISLIGKVKRVQRTERLATGGARPGVIPIALFAAAVIVSIVSQIHGLALLLLLSLPVFLTATALVQTRLNCAWTAAAAAVNGSEYSPDPAQAGKPAAGDGHAARQRQEHDVARRL